MGSIEPENDLAGRRMSAQLELHRMKRSDLADAWGCSLNTVDARLKGEQSMTISEIAKAAALFGLSQYQLMLEILQPIDSIKQVRA